MLLQVKLPQISEEHHESVIVFWHVSEGDTVQKNDVLVEVQTEKSVSEIEAPEAGMIKEIVKQRADVASVGDVLVIIETVEATSSEGNQYSKKEVLEGIEVIATPRIKKLAKELGVDWRKIVPANADGKLTENDIHHAAKADTTEEKTTTNSKHFRATPSVKKFAKENNVNLEDVVPSEVSGRISIDDVKNYIHQQKFGHEEKSLIETIESPILHAEKENQEKRISIVGTREIIANAMVYSKTTIPHVTHFDEVHVDELVTHRTNLKVFAKERNVKLTYLSYIVKALTMTLKKFPYLNSSIDMQSKEIILKEYYHIGVAVNTNNGLLVPVIKNADQKSLFTVAKEIGELSQKARDGKLQLDDMQGATCTISNIGSAKGAWFTPIINPPEACIIGVGRIDKKTTVINDEMTIGSMMALSLSYDHRIIDGVFAQEALNDLKLFISNPDLLLVD